MVENTKFVVDASFVLAFLLPDEDSSLVDAVFQGYAQGKNTLNSTFLLPFEVLNALKSAVLTKRLKKKLAESLAKKFLELEIKPLAVDLPAVFKIALQKKLTVYDASYIVLSHQQNCPLLTLDKKLHQFCRS